MSRLLKLKGAKVLGKAEQKAINGGYACVYPTYWCPPGTYCDFSMGEDGLCRRN